MTASRNRLDLFLVQNGYFSTRERAQAAIIAGSVTVNGRMVLKPGYVVNAGDAIELRVKDHPYVSRGGVKLSHALKFFQPDLTGLTAVDVGASTGGFTDCLLEAGIRRVYAIDVGYGQLAWKIRNDPRVVVMERTNIRHLEPSLLGERADFATIDVSFISLKKVLPTVDRLLTPAGMGLVLIKPQFEAGRQKVGKKGVVKDPSTQLSVCNEIIGFIRDLGWEVLGLTFSPLRGPEGNIEFFVFFSKIPGQAWHGSVEEVVTQAWNHFKNDRGSR
ncbi:MAG: TlyA family RNA methyltransferase [Bacillota bacterium]